MIDLIDKTASDEYLNFDAFLTAIAEADEDIHMLLGAGIGLSGEVGEFNEILKKHVWQGREFDADHAKKELGDIYWYFALACKALDTTPEEIEKLITDKLMKRYEGGTFTVAQSNNRKIDDK